MRFVILGGWLLSAICVLDAVDGVFVGEFSLFACGVGYWITGLDDFAFVCDVFVC